LLLYREEKEDPPGLEWKRLRRPTRAKKKLSATAKRSTDKIWRKYKGRGGKKNTHRFPVYRKVIAQGKDEERQKKDKVDSTARGKNIAGGFVKKKAAALGRLHRDRRRALEEKTYVGKAEREKKPH